MSAYRIFRDEGKKMLYVQRLAKPDLAGNQRWVIAATLKFSDMVKTPDGLEQAADLSDEELLRAVVGE